MMTKKKIAASALTAVVLLSGCSIKQNQPDLSALPALEYTRPESEVLGVTSQKTVKSQGKLSDGTSFLMYANNELEIQGIQLTDSLKTQQVLNEVLKEATMLTLNVEFIGSGTCSDLSMIQEIRLGDQVQSIGNSAFSRCTALNRIEIPTGLLEIGDYVFEGCTSLWSADLPAGIARMGRQLFLECNSLHSIAINSSVGEASFSGCTSLNDLHFGEGCTVIGSLGFADCIGIKRLVLGNQVERLEERCFSGCENLEYIYIPASLTYVGKRSFMYTNRINDIECESLKKWNAVKCEDDAFYDSHFTWPKKREIKK